MKIFTDFILYTLCDSSDQTNNLYNINNIFSSIERSVSILIQNCGYQISIIKHNGLYNIIDT